jgi:RsiW-degrading membrane proteinase PrsW (M82 family)
MHEGHDHHESRSTLWLTFIVGMCTVFIVYPFENMAQRATSDDGTGWNLLLLWSACEEIAKFAAAWLIALHSKKIFDEPIDAFVYLMTAALGFSAMENTFFLLGPLLKGETLVTILTGNMRFMGANLLHVASSGVLSIFIAAVYYRSRWIKGSFLLLGLSVAVILHAFFNYLIIQVTAGGQENIFIAFSFVWLAIIILILALERIKTIKGF